MEKVVIVGSVSDDAQAEVIADLCGQRIDVSDVISLKEFTNTEFCPRFISDETDMSRIGHGLEGQTVVLVSTAHLGISRNELAMRCLMIARAAKENGARRVILLEPDLFYSAQDRGPRQELGLPGVTRTDEDLKKFDGQPFTAKLYATLLKTAGVDEVITVHNHSPITQHVYKTRFEGRFYNYIPTEVYAHYFQNSDVIGEKDRLGNLVIAAPDEGAEEYAYLIRDALGASDAPLLLFTKQRVNERKVELQISQRSHIQVDDVAGRDVVLVDDMVRTGNTIVSCAKLIQPAKPRRVVFLVTHFHASHQGRMKLSHPAIDEIVTTDTLPPILNRDVQGRLRKKIVILKLAKWMSRILLDHLGGDSRCFVDNFYGVDMSSRHPRWKPAVM